MQMFAGDKGPFVLAWCLTDSAMELVHHGHICREAVAKAHGLPYSAPEQFLPQESPTK